jgi:hypothetical protein
MGLDWTGGSAAANTSILQSKPPRSVSLREIGLFRTPAQHPLSEILVLHSHRYRKNAVTDYPSKKKPTQNRLPQNCSNGLPFKKKTHPQIRYRKIAVTDYPYQNPLPQKCGNGLPFKKKTNSKSVTAKLR